METDQITLLNLDRDQNVSGGPQSKKQVAQRHHRRRPERDDEAQHQRMPQKFVNKWRPEANLLMLHRGICRNKKSFSHSKLAIPAAIQENDPSIDEFLLRHKGHKGANVLGETVAVWSATQLLHTLLEWR